jgi:hypothetical protein
MGEKPIAWTTKIIVMQGWSVGDEVKLEGLVSTQKTRGKLVPPAMVHTIQGLIGDDGNS